MDYMKIVTYDYNMEAYRTTKPDTWDVFLEPKEEGNIGWYHPQMTLSRLTELVLWLNGSERVSHEALVWIKTEFA